MSNEEMQIDMLTRYSKVLDKIQEVKNYEYRICKTLLNIGIDKIPFEDMKVFENSINDFVACLNTIATLLKFEFTQAQPNFKSNLEYLCKKYLDGEKSTNES